MRHLALRISFVSVLASGCVVAVPAADGCPPMRDAGPRDTPVQVDAGPPVCELDSTLGDACERTADCADGCFCNGIELCMSGTCVVGAAPCADDIECTTNG